MKNTIKHKKLYYYIQILSILPLFLYGFLILMVGSVTFSNNMNQEIKEELSHVAQLTITLLDATHPGDYSLVEGENNSIALYKGEENITTDYELLDSVKEKTGMDLTLYYQDTRILTTLLDQNQARRVGTRAPEVILQNVLIGGESRFYEKAILFGQNYFCYYCPVANSDGSVVGILFVGKPSSEIEKTTRKAVYPLCVVGILAMLITGCISLVLGRSFLHSLDILKNFFFNVANGNLHATLDASILKREDELSEMASNAMTMQRFMRRLIEHDPLTDLYNRRSSEYYFEKIAQKAKANNTSFSVVLADIDFFKKVNDTYGHEAGDLVLSNVAYELRKLTKGKGYAFRWGGEEFLLLLENTDLQTAAEQMEAFLSSIRHKKNIFGDQTIYITMTFGVVCDPQKDLQTLAAMADERLYYGKEHGRNQVVTKID